MADSIGVFVTGDREVELLFDEFPQRLHASLRVRIESLTEELYARIESAVPRRTGKLAQSVRSALRDTPDRIAGTVSVSGQFAKAAALEYGAHAAFTRKAHAMRLDHVFARKLAGPITVDVPSASVTADIAERRFLRGPEAEMAGEVEADLRAAIDEAAESE